jgi:NAD(P)H-flavin reductase
MVFESDIDLSSISGQFLTFLLPKTWFARAYSILFQEWRKFEFIIKRLENGRGWSKEICDIEVWTILKWVWPVWNFVLQKNDKSKLFICTWTWVVPFYYQIRYMFENGLNPKQKLIIWNRREEDLYYLDEFVKYKRDCFDFKVYLSQEENTTFNKWRVWDFLSAENIRNYDEFYICWNPLMVDDVIAILRANLVDYKNIFTEKY